MIVLILDAKGSIDRPRLHLLTATVFANQNAKGDSAQMSNDLEDAALVASLEREASLTPGILARLLALEVDFPDLNGRGVRRNLYRAIEDLLDAAADRTEAP